MVSKVFDAEFLTEELDLPYAADDVEFVEEHRWYSIWQGVFYFEGKNWRITYALPATEMQEDIDAFFDEKNVVATEVEKREVVVTKWVEV